MMTMMRLAVCINPISLSFSLPYTCRRRKRRSEKKTWTKITESLFLFSFHSRERFKGLQYFFFFTFCCCRNQSACSTFMDVLPLLSLFFGGRRMEKRGARRKGEREREYANAILRQPLPVPLVKTGFILNDDAHLFFLFCKRKERKNKNKINKLIT